MGEGRKRVYVSIFYVYFGDVICVCMLAYTHTEKKV